MMSNGVPPQERVGQAGADVLCISETAVMVAVDRTAAALTCTLIPRPKSPVSLAGKTFRTSVESMVAVAPDT